MAKFTLYIRATSIKIQPGVEASVPLDPLIEMLTYEDEFAEQTKTLGYIYDEADDAIYFHKGVDINYVVKLLGECRIVNQMYDQYLPMKFEYEEIVSPRNDEQRDVINFIAGLKHFSENKNSRQLFLVKKPGFGKCEPYSRKIPTPTEKGYTLMGDLKVDDYVFDRRGYPTKILNIFEQGVKDVYKITFQDGRIALCGLEHLWTVKTKNGPWQTMKLEDMLKDFKRVNKWKVEHGRDDPHIYKYYVPICCAVDYPDRKLPIDPWVLGCFIGNGCCRERTLTISSGTAEIPKRIAKMCGFNVRKNSEKNYSYSFIDPATDRSILTSEFFKDIPSIIGKYSIDKSIPEEYVNSDKKSRLRLLQGLMDTDGCISYENGRYSVTYSSCSKELLNQILKLLYSFGMTGTIVEDKRPEKYTNGYCGILVFRVPSNIKKTLFTVSNKYKLACEAANVKQKNYYSDLLIKDISFSHREECRCIMVDNPEHLYLTEDFIVTHNTYCAGVGMCLWKTKTLVITHRDNLRSQWIHSLYNMSGFSSREVHEITSSEELYDIAHGNFKGNYDVYLITHATFLAGMKRIGDMRTAQNITKNLGIGLKIIDEAHLYFKSTILIDCVFNVCRNLYLTATDGRSQKEENHIFRHVFSNAVYYKPSALLDDNQPKKWVNYITMAVNTHINPNVYKYRVAGGKGMNPASYGKWVIKNDKKNTHFKCCTDLVRSLYMEDEHAKVIIFMPLIELCQDCAFWINKHLSRDKSFPYDLTIRTINSSNSKRENELNKRADVIVTTIASAGTGTDIPGITDIICCSPYCSQISAEQIFGRIRYIPKQCHYYDIYDISVPMDKFWLKARFRKFKVLAKSITHLSWSEDN